MNKKFFSFPLFREGVRQTCVMGLVGLITVLGITLLVWLACLSSHLRAVASAMWGSSETLYGCQVALGLVVQYCIVSPLLTLFLFRFLNKREAADVYHALPHSRECLHVSYFASVMAWNLLTTLSTFLLVVVLYGVTPGMILNYSQLFVFLFNMISAQLFVGASVLFAMSITGTAFSNLLVSLMVIFLPRLLITCLGGMMNQACVIVDIEKQFAFFNPALNVASGLPICLFQAVFFGEDDAIMKCLANPGSGMYTLVLGLLLLGAALFILHARKSETAGKSSPNRLLQGVYRVTFGSILGLLPMYVLFNNILGGQYQQLSDWIGFIVLVFVVALGYFLFELLTTKKAKNMLKALPTFLLVFVTNGIFLGIILGVSSSLMAYTPNANQVDAVYLTHKSMGNYFVEKSQQVPVKDQTAKTIITKALKETVSMKKSGTLGKTTYDLYGSFNSETHTTMQVCLEGERGKQYRWIVISKQEEATLKELLETCEEYKKCLYTVPTPKTHTMVLEIDEHGAFSLTKEQTVELYTILVEEVKNLPFETWYPIAMAQTTNGKSYPFYITATVEENGTKYNINFPVSHSLFPKTFDAYLAYYNQMHPNGIETFQKTLTEYTYDSSKQIYEEYDIGVSVWFPEETTISAPAQWETVMETLISQAQPYTPGTENAVVSMSLFSYESQGGYYARDNAVDTTFFMVPLEVVEPYLEKAYYY